MVLPCGSNTDGLSVTNTRARILVPWFTFPEKRLAYRPAVHAILRCRLRQSLPAEPFTNVRGLCVERRVDEHPFENLVDVPELLVEVERAVDVDGSENAHHGWILEQQRF